LGEVTSSVTLQGTTQSRTRANFLCWLFVRATSTKMGSSSAKEVFYGNKVKVTSILSPTSPQIRSAAVVVGEDMDSRTYKAMETNLLNGFKNNPLEVLDARPMAADLVWGCIADKEILVFVSFGYFHEHILCPNLIQCLCQALNRTFSSCSWLLVMISLSCSCPCSLHFPSWKLVHFLLVTPPCCAAHVRVGTILFGVP
jgi:hypothetical protein